MKKLTGFIIGCAILFGMCFADYSIYNKAIYIKSPQNKVGIATTEPTSQLTVQGTVESILGGYKFPDGTIQTTASTFDASILSTFELTANHAFDINQIYTTISTLETASHSANTYFKLDQTTPESIINGIPSFQQGIQVGSGTATDDVIAIIDNGKSHKPTLFHTNNFGEDDTSSLIFRDSESAGTDFLCISDVSDSSIAAVTTVGTASASLVLFAGTTEGMDGELWQISSAQFFNDEHSLLEYYVDIPTAYFGLNRVVFPSGLNLFNISKLLTDEGFAYGFTGGEFGTNAGLSSVSTNQTWMDVHAIISQGGTASYEGLRIEIDERSLGTGRHNPFEISVKGLHDSVAWIDNTGMLDVAGANIGTLEGILKASNGLVGVASADSDYITPMTLSTFELKANKGIPNGYASLDINGKVPSSEAYYSSGFDPLKHYTFEAGADIAPNTDSFSIINNLKIGNTSGISGWMTLTNSSVTSDNAYAIMQSDTGVTFLNSAPNSSLQFKIGDGTVGYFDTTGTFGVFPNTYSANPKIQLYGYISEEGTYKAGEFQVDDTDNLFHIRRTDSSILATKIDMPLIVSGDAKVLGILSVEGRSDLSDTLITNHSLTVNTSIYAMTAAPLAYNGYDYSFNVYTTASDATLCLLDKSNFTVFPISKLDEPVNIYADGEESWAVGLLTISGAFHLTLYCKDSDFVGGINPNPGTDDNDYLDTWLIAITGDPIVCDYFKKSMWVANGYPQPYTWSPTTEVLASGFTAPPTFEVRSVTVFNANPLTGHSEAEYFDATTAYLFGGTRILFADYTLGNLFVGANGNASMTGGGNYVLGQGALTNATTANNNLCIGQIAGQSLTEGSWNTLIGALAGANMTTANYNFALGKMVLGHATTAQNNIGIGDTALGTLTDGGYNIAIGPYSLFNNINGSGNTSLGDQSGYSQLGSASIFIGSYAGHNATGNNELFIDVFNRGSAANDRSMSLIYGQFSNTTTNQHLYINANAHISDNMTVIGTVEATTYSAQGKSPITDGAYLFDGTTPGTVSSMEVTGGIITKIWIR